MVERTRRLPGTARARRLCVAIPTFRRPVLLQALLRGLADQSIAASSHVQVVVFDNDGETSAEAVVGAARAWFPFPLRYEHVAQPGLSSVRNAVLDYALGRFDFLAMIDDDECPQPQWLAELLRVQSSTHADVVIGPVPPVIPERAPRWLREGRFFDLADFTDTAPMSYGYSGNCLLSVASLERFGVRFDAALNFAGGEDLLFFKQLLARGANLAFAARAVALESVGAERLNAAYVLKMNYRRGNTLSLCDRRIDPSALRLTLRACKAYARFALGCASLLPLGLTRGRIGLMRALCNIALGLGALGGLFGHTYHAYRRDDRAAQ
jgi:succinoglycan biosynthesis protein ExoM